MSESKGSNGPTWYDILGVSPDASAEDIKAAWRDATDKFEPGSGGTQFRLFSEAADVLLNPERRAQYDAELAGDAETTPVAVPAAVEPVETEPPPEAEPAPAPVTDKEPEPERSSLPLRVVALACLPILLVSVFFLAGSAFGLGIGPLRVDSISERSEADDQDAGREAMAAAERALGAVLAYDYQRMDADRERAVKYLTPSYAEKFTKTFELLTVGPDGQPGPAVKTKTVVTADVLGTGVMDAEAERVRVVAFVNQNSVKDGGAPAIFQNRVVVTMVLRGDAWLIDEVKTY